MSKSRKWSCSQCFNDLFLDLDTRDQVETATVFCPECGEFQLWEASFRCKEPTHGSKFDQFRFDKAGELNALRSSFKQIQKMKVKTILILGQSGVGKSTWINSLVNYISFNTIEEAMDPRARLQAVICQTFYNPLPGKEDVSATIGQDVNDGNERRVPGMACTRAPRVYPLNLGQDETSMYQLIDTPGLGDPEGVAKDEENVRMILQELHCHNYLSAIWILLRPDEERLTSQFRYCLSELLSRIHRSANKNIFFCFTRSRPTFYNAVPTKRILESWFKEAGENDLVEILAQKNKSYCFDNESFMMLVLAKQGGIQFRKSDINERAESFAHSAKTSANLIRVVGTLKPHDIKDTISLNDALLMIAHLCKAIVPIVQLIEFNETQIARAVEEAAKTKTDAEDWGKKLTTTLKTRVDTILDLPSVTCGHKDCRWRETYYDDKRKEKTQGMVETCQYGCTLKNVSTKV